MILLLRVKWLDKLNKIGIRVKKLSHSKILKGKKISNYFSFSFSYLYKAFISTFFLFIGDMETYSLETCSLESAKESSVMSKLSEIEATVKQTQKEMQEFINFSQANSATQSETQSVRSHDSSTFTDSSLTTNDSRRLMDYQVENFLQPFFFVFTLCILSSSVSALKVQS